MKVRLQARSIVLLPTLMTLCLFTVFQGVSEAGLEDAHNQALAAYRVEKTPARPITILEEAGVKSIVANKPTALTDAKYVSVLNDYGFFLSETSARWLEAIPVLEKVLALNPKRHVAHLNLGDAYAKALASTSDPAKVAELGSLVRTHYEQYALLLSSQRSHPSLPVRVQASLNGMKTVVGMSAALAENPELHVIDIYEGIPHESGLVDVYITTRNTPLVLYFGAYQPVRWNLLVESNVRIERIILSGYHPQTVTGVPPHIPILTLPYRAGYSTTGISKPASLQGGYRGKTFYIGGKPEDEPPSTRVPGNIAAVAPEPSRPSGTELPLLKTVAMQFPISYGDGPITDESIERYKTIAVLKFSDGRGASGSGSTAAGLMTHLLTLSGFTPVERVQLTSLLNEQQLQLVHGDERAMAVNIGHLTGATAVAVGEIHEWTITRAKTETGGIVELPRVSLSLRIIDAEKGTVLFSGHGHFTAPGQGTLDGTARELLKALVTRFELKAGLITTGSLGFTWTKHVRSGTGLFTVTDFNRESPAYEAGLRPGDIIVGCNGSASRTWATDWHAKRACQAEANQTVVLDVRRGEQPLTIAVRARNRFVLAEQ